MIKKSPKLKKTVIRSNDEQDKLINKMENMLNKYAENWKPVQKEGFHKPN